MTKVDTETQTLEEQKIIAIKNIIIITINLMRIHAIIGKKLP